MLRNTHDSYEPYEAPRTGPPPVIAGIGSTSLEHLKAGLQVRVMDTEDGATSGSGTGSTTAARVLLDWPLMVQPGTNSGAVVLALPSHLTV